MSANQKSDMEFIMFLSNFSKAKLILKDFAKDERGVTAIEYAVLAVAVVALVAAFFGSGGIESGISAAASTVVSALGG